MKKSYLMRRGRRSALEALAIEEIVSGWKRKKSSMFASCGIRKLFDMCGYGGVARRRRMRMEVLKKNGRERVKMEMHLPFSISYFPLFYPNQNFLTKSDAQSWITKHFLLTESAENV